MQNFAQRKRRYNDYPSFSRSFFGERVQKLSINAGFTCPNRDGKIGVGGCTYCNNQSFNPEYCATGLSITDQIEKGMGFFKPRYKSQKYLAYFQAYTNTYDSMDVLKAKYKEALSIPGITGLVIGTRPDCISDALIEYLKMVRKKHYVTVEFGVESTLDRTLQLINRGHDFNTAREAILNMTEAGIHTGVHLILGLPLESRDEILEHARRISMLPVHTLKLHQLQLVKGTKMAQQYEENPEWFTFYSVEEYIDLIVDFLELLSPEIIIERFISQSPLHLLINQKWGLKNYEFISLTEKRLDERDTWQGRLFNMEYRRST